MRSKIIAISIHLCSETKRGEVYVSRSGYPHRDYKVYNVSAQTVVNLANKLAHFKYMEPSGIFFKTCGAFCSWNRKDLPQEVSKTYVPRSILALEQDMIHITALDNLDTQGLLTSLDQELEQKWKHLVATRSARHDGNMDG